MNIDLHCHSNRSDGLLPPAEVVARAKANGVDVLALTDHDTVEGLDAAHAAARELGIELVNGVEISVSWADITVHIVGLNIDARSAALLEGLHSIRSGRMNRAKQMGDDLQRAGIDGAFDGALEHAQNPAMIGRTHFARFLVASGVVRDVKGAFQRFLTRGKPGYVPHDWTTLAKSVEWIHTAGGIAVIAHPGRYPLATVQREALIAEFKSLGGDGIEVVTGSHTPDQYSLYGRYASEYGLLASRGSDFHAPDEGAELGSLQPLAQRLTPVWSAWA